MTWSSEYSKASILVKPTLTSRPRCSLGKRLMPSARFCCWLARSSSSLSESVADLSSMCSASLAERSCGDAEQVGAQAARAHTLCVRVRAARLKGNLGVVGVDVDATPEEEHVCEGEQRARTILVLHQDGQFVPCRRGQGSAWHLGVRVGRTGQCTIIENAFGAVDEAHPEECPPASHLPPTENGGV